MIALSVFLFALLVVAWMMAPGGEPAVAVETEPAVMQPEGQTA